VDLVKEERSRKGSKKYKGRVALLFPHYDLISYLECSCEPSFCWGFDKTLPLEFGFGGAISTLARQEGDPSGISIGASFGDSLVYW
jgi:hypothetical protein